WPGVVVGDEALTQCIIKLRRALGDDARAASYIETVSKRGYRLIAPVGERPVARRRHLAVAAASLAALAIAAWFAWPRPEPIAEPVAEVSVTVLPFEAVGEGDHAYLARGMSEDL